MAYHILKILRHGVVTINCLNYAFTRTSLSSVPVV